jgi:hypothetical protein
MAQILEPLAQPLQQFLGQVIAFFPNLIIGMFLLGIGWLIGEFVRRIITEILLRFKIDHYLTKRGFSIKLTSIIPVLFEWAIYLVFIQEAAMKFQVAAISNAVELIYQKIPGIIFAVVIAIVGYMVAEYVKKEIMRSKIIYARLMSNILFVIIVFVSLAVALKQTPIETSLIDQILLIGAASVGLGMAIAIGLGAKDVVRDVTRDVYRESKKGRRR